MPTDSLQHFLEPKITHCQISGIFYFLPVLNFYTLDSKNIGHFELRTLILLEIYDLQWCEKVIIHPFGDIWLKVHNFFIFLN